MSLRRRIFVPVAIALLPIIAIDTYNHIELRATRIQEVRNSAIDQARRVAAEQQRITDGIRNVLNTLVVLNSVRFQEAARCNRLFAAIRPNYDGFESLVATRADGSAFCAASVNSTGDIKRLSVDKQSFFKSAMEKNAFVIGGYTRVSATEAPTFHLAMPYINSRRQPRGVVYVSYSLERLADHLNGSQWTKGQTLSIIDHNGIILVRQPDWEHHVGRPITPAIWSRVKSAQTPFSFDSHSSPDGVERIYGVIPPPFIPGGLAVIIGLNRQAALAPLDEANWRGILVIAGGALLAFWLAWLIGLRLLRTPIEGLLETTQKWRAGDLAARTNLSGTTELGQLGEAFDAMAEDLERAMRTKDMLLRELNHRVMNSLQTVSSLFRIQARSLHDIEARTSFNDAANRINSIALTYRRMHSTGSVEVIDFSAFLQELCADISESLMAEGHRCSVDSDSVLLGPQQAGLLALIVNELVTNAVKYGDKSAPVEVTFNRSAESCRLTVRNAGVLPGNYDPSNSTGFGMRMVLTLVNQLSGHLDISSSAGQTEFAVTFGATVAQPPGPAPTDDEIGAAGSASA